LRGLERVHHPPPCAVVGVGEHSPCLKTVRKDDDMNSEEYFAEFDAVMAQVYGRDLAQDWEMSRMADAEMGDL